VVVGLLVASLAATANAQTPGEKIASALDEAEHFVINDKPQAHKLLNDAQRDLTKLDDPWLRARARFLECALMDERASVATAERELVAASAAGDLAAQARALICRANTFNTHRALVEAERDFAAAAKLAHKSGDVVIEAFALLNAGYLRYSRGAAADALTDLQAAYDIFARQNHQKEQVDTLTTIAGIYADSKVAQYDRAIEYYEKAIPVFERLKRPYDIADTLFNIGATYREKGDMKAAMESFQRADAIFMRLKKSDDVAAIDREIGVTLVKSGRPAEALARFDKALRYYRSSGDRDSAAATVQARGAAYTKLKRPAEAIRDLEARTYYLAADSARFLVRIDEDLAAAYELAGRWPEANAALRRHVQRQSKLFEEQRDQQAARLRVEFDTKRRDEENAALTRENALRSSALTAAQRAARLQNGVIALVVLLAATLAALFWRQLSYARRLRVMALTDELTRLPNRRHIMLVAAEAFASARATAHPMSVIMFDIDHFKRINDTWGHAAGDLVLQRVAHSCRVSLRPGDLLGRIGGEEFLVVARDASAEGAAGLAERLRSAVESTRFSDIDSSLVVTISLGVASSENFTSFEKLMQRADALLYEAKEGGRNRVARG
jgi:diguanylate cyclase (GGDEF)-like protein